MLETCEHVFDAQSGDEGITACGKCGMRKCDVETIETLTKFHAGCNLSCRMDKRVGRPCVAKDERIAALEKALCDVISLAGMLKSFVDGGESMLSGDEDDYRLRIDSAQAALASGKDGAK